MRDLAQDSLARVAAVLLCLALGVPWVAASALVSLGFRGLGALLALAYIGALIIAALHLTRRDHDSALSFMKWSSVVGVVPSAAYGVMSLATSSFSHASRVQSAFGGALNDGVWYASAVLFLLGAVGTLIESSRRA